MNSQEAVLKLAALSQESRIEIFRLLVRQAKAGLKAGEIAEQMQIQPNTLSFHLKELTSAGLIQSQRQGRSIIYSLEVGGMRELIHYLTEDCCQGRPELCKPANACC